nr:hypothetical protein [Tanacetum cinerariifolium]
IFNLSSEDCLEDLVSNKKSGNSTFSLHKELASPEVIHDSKGCTFLSEELSDTDSFNDIHPYFDDDPLSGSTTYSAHSLLEEFTNELALISYPLDYDDNHSIDQSVLTHHDDLFVDPTLKMFTDEQPRDYLFPSRFDGEKIKEAELLIDSLDLPCDILSEYDSFNSQDFSKDDVLPSPDNEETVFNPGILSYEKLVKIITQEKKLAVSFASWLFEDFDPPFYELLVFKEVPISIRLLPFSSENEEKVFKPGIYTSKKFHCCFLPELSHLVHQTLKTPCVCRQDGTSVQRVEDHFPVIHEPPQEMSNQEMEDQKQHYLDEMKRLINYEYRDKIKIAELKENFNSMSIKINKKGKLLQLEQVANLSTYPSKRFNSFCYDDDDDDEDYTIAVTPSLSTEEPDNSLNISSGSTTTRSNISLLEYEALYDDYVKEISSGSTTTHFDSSLYDSFVFDLSINPFPPTDRSDFNEFADELIHIDARCNSSVWNFPKISLDLNFHGDFVFHLLPYGPMNSGSKVGRLSPKDFVLKSSFPQHKIRNHVSGEATEIKEKWRGINGNISWHLLIKASPFGAAPSSNYGGGGAVKI